MKWGHYRKITLVIGNGGLRPTSYCMKTRITVDASGRVLIPKELRDCLGLGPGDVLELSNASEQIILKPVRQTVPLEKKHGFWIYTGQAQAGGGEPSAERLIAEGRETRADSLLGVGTPRKE